MAWAIYPKNSICIPLVPAIYHMMREEAPRIAHVRIRKEDTHPVASFGLVGIVVPPDETEKERSGRGHDRDVRGQPIAIVLLEGVNDTEEERVARYGSHDVVGDARGFSSAYPGWVGEERIETAFAALKSVVSRSMM